MVFLLNKQPDGNFRLTFLIDKPELKNRQATISFYLLARNKAYTYSSGIVEHKTIILQKDLLLDKDQYTFDIPVDQIRQYIYHGTSIDITYAAQFSLDGKSPAPLDNETIFDDPDLLPSRSAPISTLPTSQKSTFNPWKTFQIFSPGRKAIFLISLFLLLFLIVAPLITATGNLPQLGVFLSKIPSQNLLYIIPLCTMVAVSMMDNNYISLQLKKNLPIIKPDSEVRLKDLIETQAKLNLNNIGIEIIGHLIEKNRIIIHGKRGPSPIDNQLETAQIQLFQQSFPFLPQGATLESNINKTIDFAKLFQFLPPLCQFGLYLGLTCRVDILIRNQDYPSKKLSLPAEIFQFPQPQLTPTPTDK